MLLISLFFGYSDVTYFDTKIAQEDGAVEYSTAILLVCISILCFYRFFTTSKNKSWFWKLGTLGFALLFLFGAGEEISWGQRIFNIESSEFFLKNNAQNETNLHNLVVGDTKINKLIFSQLLMVVMVVYLIIIPLIYRKSEWVRNLVNKFAVPVVQWHHTIAFLATTVLVTLIPSSRKWEVYELAFGLIFLLIFLNPFNKEILPKN